MARFLGFQAGHAGGALNEKALAKLTPADIRAFITFRRNEGLGPGGVQRALAAVRSFYKFLAKEEILELSLPFPSARRGYGAGCRVRFRRKTRSAPSPKPANMTSNGWVHAMRLC